MYMIWAFGEIVAYGSQHNLLFGSSASRTIKEDLFSFSFVNESLKGGILV